jgi:hypothetical protein
MGRIFAVFDSGQGQTCFLLYNIQKVSQVHRAFYLMTLFSSANLPVRKAYGLAEV